MTDLLLEVDRWTGFAEDFTQLKNSQPTKNRRLLLTAILADAINLGLKKMAKACPETSSRNCRGSRLRGAQLTRAMGSGATAIPRIALARASSSPQRRQPVVHSILTGRGLLRPGR
jgi:hypothetical protein